MGEGQQRDIKSIGNRPSTPKGQGYMNNTLNPIRILTQEQVDELVSLRKFKEHIRQARKAWAGRDYDHLDMMELLEFFRKEMSEKDGRIKELEIALDEAAKWSKI